MRKSLLLMLVLMGFALTVFAQADQQAPTEDKELNKSYLYQWTDDKGVVQITDNLGNVPTKYRDKAVKLEQSNKEDADQGQQVQQGSGSPAGAESEADEDLKEEWQQRMRDAKERLAEAEKNYQDLVQQRDKLLQSLGSPALGREADRSELNSLEQEMKDVQKEIDEARKMSTLLSRRRRARRAFRRDG